MQEKSKAGKQRIKEEYNEKSLQINVDTNSLIEALCAKKRDEDKGKYEKYLNHDIETEEEKADLAALDRAELIKL